MPLNSRRALAGAFTLAVLAGCAADTPQDPGDPALAAGTTPQTTELALYGAGGGTGPACDGPKYRQFDFWRGRWDVTSGGAPPTATNVISRALDGCALLEDYENGGFVGRSLNSYDAATDRWHQHWVDHVGTVLDLFGRFRDGSMVLEGVRPTLSGNNNVDRITWTKLAPARVRQFWETSTDFGQTFPTVVFDGLYLRNPSITRGGETPQTTCQDPSLPALTQFDFTLGSWNVAVAAPDAPQGLRSRITKDLSGCLIEERVSGADGYEAIVFTSVRRRLGLWVKTFVDNRRTNAFVSGGLTDGRLILKGTAPSARGRALEVRVIYTELSDGRFEQRWEKTRDGGASWTRLLVARYSPR